MQIVSNERYKAVVHRAVVGGEKERISFVSMVAPCLDAVVEPVHELAAADGRGVEFRGIKYRQRLHRGASAEQQGRRDHGDGHRTNTAQLRVWRMKSLVIFASVSVPEYTI